MQAGQAGQTQYLHSCTVRGGVLLPPLATYQGPLALSASMTPLALGESQDA